MKRRTLLANKVVLQKLKFKNYLTLHLIFRVIFTESRWESGKSKKVFEPK